MKKFLLVLLFFYLGFVLFMPKINLYYTLENFAKKEHVEIKEGVLKDRWWDLKIDEAKVYYDGISSFVAAHATIVPWIVYNRVHLSDVRPSKELERILRVHAKSVILTHSLLDYKHLLIEAEGDFGLLHGTLDLMARQVKLILEPSEKFKNHSMVRQYFKKGEEGLVYESKL